MSTKYPNPTKQPQVALSFELFTTTTTTVVEFWKSTKIINTKAEKVNLLIVNSTVMFRTMINTKYPFVITDNQPSKLEDLYGTQFAKDVITNAMQELLTGIAVH